MAVVVIINPIAGGARHGAARLRVRTASAALQAVGAQGDIFVTERRGHARELAQRAIRDRATMVVAWGGDGTVNEVGSALAESDIPLGIVPAGSGNGLAADLGVSRRPAQAIAEALGAKPRLIDAGEINGRFFASLAGVGFDAHIAECFDRDSVRRGLWNYARLTLREILSYESKMYRLDGTSNPRAAFLVTLANTSQFGNGARIAPGARLDDGKLNLVVFEEVSRLSTVLALPRLFTGGAGRVRGMETTLVERVTIESDTPMPFHVDGELGSGGVRLEASVRAAALKVCVR
jgi:YegS/Rv2252/BmrU family lipid kinase